MKLKDMTVGQRILYKHYSRVWNSRCDAMWAIENLRGGDKRLANAIDREIRKVAEKFWIMGQSERDAMFCGVEDRSAELYHELENFNLPKPSKKGAKK